MSEISLRRKIGRETAAFLGRLSSPKVATLQTSKWEVKKGKERGYGGERFHEVCPTRVRAVDGGEQGGVDGGPVVYLHHITGQGLEHHKLAK